MKPGVPAGLPMITLPLAPKVDGAPTWDEIIAKHAADDRQPGAPGRRAVHADLHLGHHRPAQGRDAQLRHLRLVDHLRPEARQARFQRPHAELPAAGPRGRAHAGRARPAGHRHARVLRRQPGHLRRRHPARAADGVLLGAAAVGQVPAGRAGQDAGREARPAAEDPDPARHREEEDPHRPGPGPGALCRRRRRADADLAAQLVPQPRAGHRRGLRHDRELRPVACHAAAASRGRARSARLRRRAVPHRPGHRRDPGQGRMPDARLLQAARGHQGAPSPTTAG